MSIPAKDMQIEVQGDKPFEFEFFQTQPQSAGQEAVQIHCTNTKLSPHVDVGGRRNGAAAWPPRSCIRDFGCRLECDNRCAKV